MELKKDVVTEEHVDQIEDYIQKMKKLKQGKVRGLVIGQIIPPAIQLLCTQRDIEWKVIKVGDLYTHLQKYNNELLSQVFFARKLHEKAKEVKTLSFQEYLDATSPYGRPYTSYQFFKPLDASPKLSEDKQENQIVADEFKEIILKLDFNRELFNGNVRVMRSPDSEARWAVKTKDGSWQGYIMDYLLYVGSNQQPIPCELYIGTIGYRGNPKSTYADERSRFIVLDIGKGKHKISTQYGFHKYLITKERALLPFYELKFNATGVPKENWEKIYFHLNEFEYYVEESENQKSKLLRLGDINLDKETTETEVANLIEGLFATTIVKSHFSKEGKGIPFEFFYQIE